MGGREISGSRDWFGWIRPSHRRLLQHQRPHFRAHYPKWFRLGSRKWSGSIPCFYWQLLPPLTSWTCVIKNKEFNFIMFNSIVFHLKLTHFDLKNQMSTLHPKCWQILTLKNLNFDQYTKMLTNFDLKTQNFDLKPKMLSWKNQTINKLWP